MKRKVKVKSFGILIIMIIVIVTFVVFVMNFNKLDKNKEKDNKDPIAKEVDFKGKKVNDALTYCEEKKIKCSITYEYDEDYEKDLIIKNKLEDKNLYLTVSVDKSYYEEHKINELGKVPIMMYHGIVNIDKTDYTGGNVDKDGYNRTAKAFKEDLEFYYTEGYRMVRLIDYVNGNINTEFGKSPIILTFDDGNKNNFNVLGKNEDGSLKIDPESAVGILEEFKKKYPDYNITATFFLNSALFNQKEYNEEIIKWLVNNGYDIGNHTTTHADFTTISKERTVEVVGKMYNILNDIIPDKYVSIVALPFGSPYKKNHANYPYILSGEYEYKKYETVAALRVGWESEVSPFDKVFDSTFLKRCRAYDNNGKDFDITMTFNSLKGTRYISDGNIDTIIIPKSKENSIKETDKKIIIY